MAWNPLNEAGTQARAPFSLLAPVPEKVPKRPPKCSLLGTVWAHWAPKCRFWAVLGTASNFMFFWKGPDAHFGSKMVIKWIHPGLTFWHLFGIVFLRVPPSVKSTLKVTFFIEKIPLFPPVFCIKHIKNTVFEQCWQ